ncbi:MAG: hypothetical protein ABI461_05200 [Polyangiaceae bacterium]
MILNRLFSCGLLGLGAALSLSFTTVGCGGSKGPAVSPSEVSAQKAVVDQPDLSGIVVGTIGRDHLIKDGYPLTKIADIIDVYKPDLLLIQVRADAYKKLNLEDASFEMTYVNAVAGTAGVETAPIDWFKDEDVLPQPGGSDDTSAAPPKKGKKGAPTPVDATDAKKGGAPPDPFNYSPPVDVDPDFAGAFKDESAALDTLGPLSFADANNDANSLKIWDAMSAQIRYTKGYSPLARRLAWMGYNATQAYQKDKGQVHRVMVVVNVRYRAAMEQVIAGWGAVVQDPVAIAKSAEQTHDSIPDSVFTQWHREVDRLHDKLPKHGPETLRISLLQKIAILQAAADKKGVCCVDASALAPKDQ